MQCITGSNKVQYNDDQHSLYYYIDTYQLNMVRLSYFQIPDSFITQGGSELFPYPTTIH